MSSSRFNRFSYSMASIHFSFPGFRLLVPTILMCSRIPGQLLVGKIVLKYTNKKELIKEWLICWLSESWCH
jgi:hypothetical protein